MSERRNGVLIASSQYQDSKLENLRCPENDVDGLNAVLKSKEFGDFAETYVLKNKSHDEVLRKIYQVLKQAGKDDLILIYYSGHGKLNAAGKLHLTTTDTNVDLLDPTSIPLETIRSYIDISPSNKFILILDSCFSGAAGKIFARGSIDDQLQLASGGRGTYVMTASTGIQIANEKEGDQYGLFTKHIIDGIKSGKAANEEGLVTMDTLYKHVHDQVLKESSQEPMKWDLNVRGELVIARSMSMREARAKQIKKMLKDNAALIPDYITNRALEIIGKKAGQLSEEEHKYDILLDRLYQESLELNDFIQEWNLFKRDKKAIKDAPIKINEEQLKQDLKIFGMPAESGRWIIVIFSIVIELLLGIIYSYGSIRGQLSTYFQTLNFNITAMDTIWPFIIFLLMFSLTMPIAGSYIQRMGPTKVFKIGGTLCGLGWFAVSYAGSPAMLIPYYGIICGLGVGIAYGCPIATVAQWFPDRRGFAIGLTVLGFGFSSLVLSLLQPASNVVIKDFLNIFGVVILIVSLLLSTFLIIPPDGWKPAGWAPPTPAAGAAQRVDFMRNEMIKTSTFKGLWICYAIGALAGLMAIGIVGPVAKEVMTNAGMVAAGITTLVYQLILPFAICNGLARPVFGTLTDKLTPKNAAMITFVGIIVACLLQYTMYSSIPAFIITFCILWSCLGAWLAIAPAATALYFGMKDNAKNYGLMFTAYGVGAVIGGITSAMIAVSTPAKTGFQDAYQPFFLVVAVLAAIGIVVAFMLLKPPVKKAA